MKCWYAVLMIAACSAPPKKVPQKPVTPTVDAMPPIVTVPTTPLDAVVKQIPTRPMIESPHAGPIKLIATTLDGNSALTVDDIDGLRLWPKLDGTIEPRVVELVRPKALALGRTKDGFVAVVIDDVGGLVIATLDPDGRTKQRATLAPDPGFLGAAVVGDAILAWRTDQTVFLLDTKGAAIAHTVTDPGERIAGVMLAADSSIVVLVETATDTEVRRRPRPLKIDKTELVWGPRVDIDADTGTNVALSPSGKRLAALLFDKAKSTTYVVAWELATAKPIGAVPVRFATNIAFVDEDHVANLQPNAIEWSDLATAKPLAVDQKFEMLPPQPQRTPYAMGAGRVIAPRNDELALVTPAKTEYLGYGLESPQVAAVGAGGQLMIGLGETFALLDKDLREVSAPASLVPKQSSVTELKWLQGSSWLVETSGVSDGMTAVAIVDIAADTRKELRSKLAVAQIMMYEPETKLVTFSLGDAPEVAKYNADKQQLDKVITLAKPNGFEQRELIPIAPSLAAGSQLLSVQMRDKTTLRWVANASSVDTGPSTVIDGSLASWDRAGHAYVWQNSADHKLSLAVFDKGKQVGTLPTEGTTTVWPDPKGARAILLTGRGVALYGLDGTKQWELAVQGTTEAQWLDDGTIALISAGGLARVNPAKGEITATRCGWRFGLTATPHPFTSRIEPVCVQQR